MGLNKKQVENFLNRTGYDLEKGRPTMDALRARFNKLKRQLTEADRFEPVDEIHLTTIVMCEDIQLRAYMDVVENGTLAPVDKDKKIYQKNHSISTLFQMSKMINETSKKLGLSPLDRKELNIEKEIDDGMED